MILQTPPFWQNPTLGSYGGHMGTLVKVLQDMGLLLARLVFGAVMIYHGWNRWRPGVQQQADYLAQYGLPEPLLLAWGAVGLEVIGGFLIIFGILTPVVAGLFVVEFVMIVLWIQWHHGIHVLNNGVEYSSVLAVLALLLTVFGAGRTGVDRLFRRSGRRRNAVDEYDPA